MPTGYTSKLCDGEQTFEAFVWGCARAFGALIMMRDDPESAEVPQRFEPSDWNERQLERARSELARVKGLTSDECRVEAEREYSDQLSRWRESAAKVGEVRSRLERMRRRVEGWKPPSQDHVPMRTFMLEQLQATIDGDGTMHGDPPKLLSATDWKQEQVRRGERDVAYHTKQHAEEVARTEDRNRWVNDLRRSVPQPKRASS